MWDPKSKYKLAFLFYVRILSYQKFLFEIKQKIEKNMNFQFFEKKVFGNKNPL